MKQLKLFPTIINNVFMIAQSPKHAFYRLRLEEWNGDYMIIKESGAGDKILDRRRWFFDSLEQAEINFKRRITKKTNPDRKESPRKYRLIQ